MQFRKAKALAGIGYTEKAIKILEDLVSKNQNGMCSGTLVDFRFDQVTVVVRCVVQERTSCCQDKGQRS